MEQLVNFIIRPPRADYSPKDDLLDHEFMLKGRWYRRKDLEVTNSRGNVLQCSHYSPIVFPEGEALPCVIYCHGNSGCRADASEAAIILLTSNITVFTLDFSGSGLSEGEHVTLGCNEKDDLRVVVDYLRKDGNVSCIGLWGRSMGAVTSLMYGVEDPSIAGMVLDSPFSNLVDLMMELVDTYKYPLPKFTIRRTIDSGDAIIKGNFKVKLAIQHMRKVIKKKANFDIMDLDTIQVAKSCFVPVLLGHATDDDFIHPHHSDRIYEAYAGDKNIIKFDGDHNSPRPQFYFDSITIFFHNVLRPPSDEQYIHTMHDPFDKGSWDSVHGMEYGCHNFTGPRQDGASGSTEDAIAQLRSRRPMSRTEVPSDIASQEKQDGPEGNEIDGPSSSRLFSTSFPNGDSHSQVDDEYVEYSFDDFSDLPSSIEDEEKMIMEAIIESLKDMESRHPEENAESNVGTAPNDPSSHDVHDSIREPNGLPPEASIESSSIMPSTSNENPSGSAQTSTSDVRTGDDGTRATLVVEKNPSGHVIEGLVHRWGLNLFKSKR